MGGMVNKLRVYAAVLGAGLVLLSGWAVLTYDNGPGGTSTFVGVALVGVGVAVLPVALAYGKLQVERWRHTGLGGVTYVSAPFDVTREEFIDRSRELFANHGGFAEVKDREFREGSGFIIDHTAFHGTFVRYTRARRVVVTGVTADAVAAVVDVLQAGWETTFRTTSWNPFMTPIPVRGAPRQLLTVGLTVVVVLQVFVVAGAAYPSDVYNPGERAFLVGIDLHTDLSPATSETDGRLDKARFLVSVVREQAVEVRWSANRTDAPVPEPTAETIAAEVERLLDAARADGPSTAQRARIEAIERDLASALLEVERARARAARPATPTTAA